jgi:D-alanyl-D-alanine carboxypeptidase/D-alanyl-D-alanine-endopeptidase (penicillin-binding protein 4)
MPFPLHRLLLLFLPFWFFAQVPQKSVVQASLLKLINDPQLKGTKWSVCAIDLNTGDTIASFDATQQLPGASIVKLISTAASLHILGPAHSAHTQLNLEGTMHSNGVFDGNLRIIGTGDVSLGSKYFNASGSELQFLHEWAQLFKQNGIKVITGDIIADATGFGVNQCPLGWEQADMGNYYGCGAFGLNFYDNTLKLNFQTGATGTPVKLKSLFPSDQHYKLIVETTAASIASDQSYIYGEPFNNQRTIKGRLPANRSNFEVKASMPDPERLLAEELYNTLQEEGIRVDGGAISARKMNAIANQTDSTHQLLYTHQGKTLSEIIYWTNQQSVNLFAEGNLLQLGLKRYGTGTYENSLMVLDSLLMEWEVGPCRIVDGSGLSKENRMSASQFVQLLKIQTKSPHFDIFYKSLPIAGMTGTVKNLCKGQAGEGKVHAKSGSIKGVKAYAGYVESASGHQIVFAIIANDYTISGFNMAKKMEPFFNSLATY